MCENKTGCRSSWCRRDNGVNEPHMIMDDDHLTFLQDFAEEIAAIATMRKQVANVPPPSLDDAPDQEGMMHHGSVQISRD